MKTVALPILCLLTFAATAQNLLTSRQSSTFTYLYRLSNEEAKSIYQYKEGKKPAGFFHTLVDSFYTDSIPVLHLPKGHYLKTSIQKGNLVAEILTVPALQVVLFNNSADLCIAVQDSLGQPVSDALVTAKHRRIRFDEKTQLYRLAKANKKGRLTIEYEGFETWYSIDRRWNNPGWKRALNGVPLRYLWRPVSFAVRLPVDAMRTAVSPRKYLYTTYQTKQFFVRAYQKIVCLFDDYNCEEDREDRFARKWRGYLVFNKPKYLPGDTVKYKAFVTNLKGRPLVDSVTIALHKTWTDQKIVGRLVPYTPGAYTGEFVLHDSLGLRLDQSYTVSIQKRKDRIYVEESFRYEDYELRSIVLQVRSDVNRHFRGEDFEVFLKGTDENDLNLADARVEMVVRPLEPLEYHANALFLPDTLWRTEQSLEPSGETAIAIPDSVFPQLNLEYELLTTMLTSDNERKTDRKVFTFYHLLEEPYFELKADSIRFSFQRNGKSVPETGQLSRVDPLGFSTHPETIQLPHQEKLNAHWMRYELLARGVERQFLPESKASELRMLLERGPDSMRMVAVNPRNLPFRYFLYEVNQEVERGYGTVLDIRRQGTGNRKFQIVLQYLWGGFVREDYFESDFQPNQLNIVVKQPALVYPGQQLEVEVAVTDQLGKPVPDVDLTAYGLTKKFEYEAPRLPLIRIKTRSRKLINRFTISPEENRRLSSQLDFPVWQKKAALDTIEYYRFLYPGHEVYRFEAQPPDSVTQFSPFVVNNGKVEPVHVVYLDQKPVYFSWSENERPYAFHTSPGYHRVELRTQDRMYRLDSLYMTAGRKLVFSLSDSIRSGRVSITPMPKTLNNSEKDNLYRYIFPFRHTFGSETAYLRQGYEVLLLQQKHLLARSPNTFTGQSAGSFLAGPVSPNGVKFVLANGFESYFEHEPFFEYDFLKGILKMRQITPANRYPKTLFAPAVENLGAWTFSEAGLLKERQLRLDAWRRQNARYQYPQETSPGKGKLRLVLKENKEYSKPLNILLLHRKDPGFFRVYPGTTQAFHDLTPGNYRMVWIYDNARYALMDSLFVQGGGMNYRFVENLVLHPRDTFSDRMNEALEQQMRSPVPNKKGMEREVGQIRQLYQGSFSWSGPGKMIHGRVTDETGEPLIGATVMTSSRTNGVVTDIDGNYSLFLPEGETAIQINYTGYHSVSVEDVGNQSIVDVALTSAVQLDEVLVTAYKLPLIEQDQTAAATILTSEQIRGLPTRDINALEGIVAGLSIEKGGEVTILGSRASDMLYYVDGIRAQGNMLLQMGKEDILKTEILQGESATAVFGPEAANGVVLITTKKGGKGATFDEAFLEAAGQASSIRTNFSDYAFWQPRLRTDAAGKAVFKVTFPDDITNWDTFVLGMNGNKQSGQAEGNIRSFKPVAARLSLPRFLVQGDSAWAIGKVLNYLPDTVSLRAGFALGDAAAVLRDYRIVDAVTDSVLLSPTTTDSLQVKYFLQKQDGYTDGEQRSIEVFPSGLERTAGKFIALEGDTTLQWIFPDSLGAVHLYARADVLDVVEEEIARLIYYQYDCNEQMASRLKALLAEEQIAAFKKKKFLRRAQAQKLIDRIVNNQNEQGLWGWWNRSATSYWISIHVLETLLEARKKGYAVKLAEQKITEQAIWELESKVSNARKLELLRLLHGFNAKINYHAYLPFLEKDTTLSVVNRFRLMELQQLTGSAWSRDTLARYRQETLFGNVYFAGDKQEYEPSVNTLQLTLSAYRLLQRDSLSDKTLPGRIRNYFLEQRSHGTWNNTFETAQIIEAILPAAIRNADSLQIPVLQLSGAVTAEVKNFPFETTFAPGQSLVVSKTGDFPVYFTAYQRYWDAAPRENSEHFSIQTTFANGGNRLRAGKPENLEVTVEVKKDAQYVMIEVPIPASCSYESKRAYFPGEVHREYFRHKTAIFCENLKPGTHRFSIELLPRYAGMFTLNPAKVELMYFPVFQANNEKKKVHVER